MEFRVENLGTGYENKTKGTNQFFKPDIKLSDRIEIK